MVVVPALPLRIGERSAYEGVGASIVSLAREAVAEVDRCALRSSERREAVGTWPLQVATWGLCRLDGIGVGLDPQVDAARTHITDPQRRAGCKLTFQVEIPLQDQRSLRIKVH